MSKQSSKDNNKTPTPKKDNGYFETRGYTSHNGYVKNGNEEPKYFNTCHRYRKDPYNSSSEELTDEAKKEKFFKDNQWVPPISPPNNFGFQPSSSANTFYPSFWEGDEQINQQVKPQDIPKSTNPVPKQNTPKQNVPQKSSSKTPKDSKPKSKKRRSDSLPESWQNPNWNQNFFPYNDPFFNNMYQMCNSNQQYNPFNQPPNPYFNQWFGPNFNYGYNPYYDNSDDEEETQSEDSPNPPPRNQEKVVPPKTVPKDTAKDTPAVNPVKSPSVKKKKRTNKTNSKKPKSKSNSKLQSSNK